MGLDLGCGPHKAFPHFIGVDNLADVKLFGTRMQPDFVVKTCEKLEMFASQSMNFIFSSHLLEHIQDHEGALKEWWRLVKVGGHLCLYLPHKEFYPNIGTPGSNPDHKHDFLPDDIVEAMKKLVPQGAWDLVENQERNEDQEYSFFQVYRKIKGDKWRMSYKDQKPEKTCAIVRYGAFGDLIMASSILPELKKQGYHITLYTVPRGYEVVKHDPNIDKVILQDVDQVPNPALGDFWRHEAKKYDKFINLCESVEGTFLATQDKIASRWSHEVRHEMLNKNYVEFHHKIAGVPYSLRQKFYSTDSEKEWARKERLSMKTQGPVILWSLAGSSVHKVWPHIDTIIARLMIHYPDCRVVFVGDELCKMIEYPWENEKRVIPKSGIWSIRESLSFIAECDLVIGPETGVMNAAAMDRVSKIVTLSHSSVENLTRDWMNCISLTPANTPCYPCHMMHYNFDNCHRGEKTGVAACQEDISEDAMWDAVQHHLADFERKAA